MSRNITTLNFTPIPPRFSQWCHLITALGMLWADIGVACQDFAIQKEAPQGPTVRVHRYTDLRPTQIYLVTRHTRLLPRHARILPRHTLTFAVEPVGGALAAALFLEPLQHVRP